MQACSSAAFAIFVTTAKAEAAVDCLTMAGFSSRDVSVLLCDKGQPREFVTEQNTKAPEGASAGAGFGGMVGGTLGLLVGIGALAIPGFGALIVAGPLMASLAGLGLGGAVGGFVGALVGMGIPEYEAKLYDGRVRNGAVLLAIRCADADQILQAKQLLKTLGAEDIATCGEDLIGSADLDDGRAA
jgi:hypothetical protein